MKPPVNQSNDGDRIVQQLSGINFALHVIAGIMLARQEPGSVEIPAELGTQIDALKAKFKASADALNAAVDAAPQ